MSTTKKAFSTEANALTAHFGDDAETVAMRKRDGDIDLDAYKKESEEVLVKRLNKYDFCHLHRHCEASIQDGVGKIEDGVRYAKEMGHKAVAVTDHGNIISFVRFYNEAKDQDIKHIFGLEAYITDDMTLKDKEHKSYNHCTILVKNQAGFNNLLKLNNISHRDGFYYKPRVDWDTLFDHREGLIILSGCVLGRTCQYILNKEYDRADEWTRLMLNQMGDDYYIELMLSDFPQQRECNEYLLELSKKYNIPGVITGDAHYVHKEDYQAQRTMMLISAKATMSQLEEQQRRKAEAKERGETFDERDKIWIFESDQYWMKNEDEMIESWRKWHQDYYPFELVESHLNESGRIADKVEDVSLDTSYKIPHAIVPEGQEHEEYFIQLLREGMDARGLTGKQEYEDRLAMEINIIKEKGLIDYFLVNADVIGWAKRNNIFVGPARGSAGGSLVCYCLHITEIDPIRYDLLFERFLDLGREEMPDIDTDFEIEERDRVKQYIAQRYGEHHVANIAALGTFRARNIVRDICRVYDYPPQQINEISKAIPEDAVFIDNKMYVGGEEFHNRTVDQLFQESPQIRDIASVLFGQIRHISKHAAGVIVTDKPLEECVATIRVGDDVMTAWTDGIYYKELSQLNVLKLDILGLRTLTILKRACEFAGIRYQSLLDIDLEDETVYKLIAEHELIKGIFQFDSNTGAWLYFHMKPRCFNDLIALAALDRPGPLDSFKTFEYIDIMNGKLERVKYEHPIIEKILSPTYGAIVYQEQLMFLAKELSGFTAAEASALRKNLVKGSLSKKGIEKEKKLRKTLKKKFIDGALANNCSKKEAEFLWSAMITFARYGFNKAHSTAYALVSYWTMWMKIYHPTEFYAALLTYSNEEDLPEILHEMKKMHIKLAHPDINKSGMDFTPIAEENRVVYGLNRIKFLGVKAQEAIVQARPFSSFSDLEEKVEKKVLNKRAKEALIRCGALANIEPNIDKLLTDLHNSGLRKKDTPLLSVGYNVKELIDDEKKYLGFVLSAPVKIKKRRANVANKFKQYQNKQIEENNPELKRLLQEMKGDFFDPNTGITYERFTGFVVSVDDTTSKSGNKMRRLDIDSGDGTYDTFFIMEWDKFYGVVATFQSGDPIGIAILKREHPKAFPQITHMRKLT